MSNLPNPLKTPSRKQDYSVLQSDDDDDDEVDDEGTNQLKTIQQTRRKPTSNWDGFTSTPKQEFSDSTIN